MERLSVVIPTYNRLPQLRRALAGLERQRMPLDRFEVIVVSDGSSDGTDAYLLALTTPLTINYIRQENVGVAAARNRGIEAAEGELLLFLDDDVVPTANLVHEHLLTHHDHGSSTVVLGPMLTPPDVQLQPWVDWEQQMLMKQYEDMAAGIYAPTARQFFTGNTSLARCHLQRHGGFDIRFRRAEDVELAYRLERADLQFVFNAQAIGYHYAERSFGSWLSTPYAYGRNDVVFWRDLGHEWLLPTVWREYCGRHRLIRNAVVACLDRPVASEAFVTAMKESANMSSSLARMAYSAIFNLRYYQGVADELGGRDLFFAGLERYAQFGSSI